jgi:hypothetical protein
VTSSTALTTPRFQARSRRQSKPACSLATDPFCWVPLSEAKRRLAAQICRNTLQLRMYCRKQASSSRPLTLTVSTPIRSAGLRLILRNDQISYKAVDHARIACADVKWYLFGSLRYRIPSLIARICNASKDALVDNSNTRPIGIVRIFNFDSAVADA